MTQCLKLSLRGVGLTGERLGRDEAACDRVPVLTLRIAGHRQAASEEGDVPEVGEHHAHSCIIHSYELQQILLKGRGSIHTLYLY